jgi:hypothetical protein
VLENWRYSITPRSFSHAGGPDPSSVSIKIFTHPLISSF